MATIYRLSVQAVESNPNFKPRVSVGYYNEPLSEPAEFDRGTLSLELTEAQWEWLRTAALEAWRKS